MKYSSEVMKGTLLRPNGRTQRWKGTFDEAQRAIGGYIERVVLQSGGVRRVLLVNEDAGLIGLPVNELASELYRLARNGKREGGILGPAILLAEGEDVS